MTNKPSTSLIKLTPSILSHIRNNKKDFCRQCKINLKVNKMIVSKRSIKSSNARNIVYYHYYHEDCARRLNIIE
jgi:hypothetical protein